MKEHRSKFTTTLTPSHVSKLVELTGKLGFRNLNDTIEFLVDKELGAINNEVENKRNNNRRKDKSNSK